MCLMLLETGFYFFVNLLHLEIEHRKTELGSHEKACMNDSLKYMGLLSGP